MDEAWRTFANFEDKLWRQNSSVDFVFGAASADLGISNRTGVSCGLFNFDVGQLLFLLRFVRFLLKLRRCWQGLARLAGLKRIGARLAGRAGPAGSAGSAGLAGSVGFAGSAGRAGYGGFYLVLMNYS